MRYKLIFAIALAVILFGCEEPVKNNLNIQTINVIEPMDGSINNLTTTVFDWDDLLGVDNYQFEVATPDFTEEDNIIISEQLQRSNYEAQFTQGSYIWRVKAINSQTETLFSLSTFSVDTTLNLSSQIVTILNPLDNSVQNNDSILIQWEDVSMANQYNLIIEEAVGNTVMTEKVLTTNQYLAVFGEGTYRVKVKAMNFATTTQYTTHSFVIDFTPPTPPVINAPTNGATVTSPVPLSWNSHLSAAEDSIFIYLTAAAITPLIGFSSVNQSHNFTAASGIYYWNVISYDATGNASPPSAVQSFIVQ